MRPIKFRAWAKPVYEDGEEIYEGMMIEPEYINALYLRNFNKIMNGPTGTGIEYYVQGPLLPGLGYLEKLKSDEIELLQYTGLKDKNGKEIYEGDIVKAPYMYKNAVCEVFWHRNHWAVRDKRGALTGIGYSDLTDDWAPEIIGNIFQNPELLKEVEPVQASPSPAERGNGE